MNPLTFAEIINDLPDDIIEAAAKPQSRSVRWYQLSAIAAGIVLLIAAAVYPKLRMQTPPVIEPPVYTETATVTTTTVTETVMQTNTQTSTALLTMTATERTTVTKTETDAQTGTAQTAVPATTGEQHDTPATAPPQQETDIPADAAMTTAANTTIKAAETQDVPVVTTTRAAATQTIPVVTTAIPDCTTTAAGTQIIPEYTTTVAMWTQTTAQIPVDAPEPQTLTVPVWRDAWSPAVGYPEISVPAEAQYSVTVHDAQFMQEVWHWSPPDIQVFDYDYLRIGVSANAADAALLHAEYSGGELVVTVGLQAAETDRFLSRVFLLPVPKWLHIYGNQCSVKFEYTDFSSQPGMEQPQKIELNIS